MIQLLLVIFLILAVYAWFVEPGTLKLNEQVVGIDPKKLAKPIRLLFLSDIHAGFLVSPRHLHQKLRILAAAHAAQPFEAVLLGGDFVDLNPAYVSQVEEMMRLFRSWKVPVVGVLGNHDFESTHYKPESLVKELEKGGIEILRNQSAVLTAGGQELLVIGLEELESSPEYSYPEQRLSVAEYRKRAGGLRWLHAFDASHPGLPRILLVHNPDGSHLPRKSTPDLILAGHTHGGQYAFLDWTAKWLRRFMPRGSFNTAAGRHLINGSDLIISRGFGGSLFPARFLRPPEAIAITLRPAAIPQNLIIGLSGKPRSGKDTVAAMLERMLPGITRSDFSHLMREEYDTYHGTNIRHDEAEKERHRLKLTEFVNQKRQIDEYYWINKVFALKPPLLVTPIRYHQEIQTLHKLGGSMVLIRSGHDSLRKRMAHDFEEQMKGFNENQINDYTEWDYIIENDGTLRDLENKVRQVLAEIVAKLPKE